MTEITYMIHFVNVAEEAVVAYRYFKALYYNLPEKNHENFLS